MMIYSAKKTICLTIVSILLIGAAVWSAVSPSISVLSSVSNSNITIGDKITYTLKVIHSPEIKVTMPTAGINLGDFEIKDFQVFEPIKTKEGLREEKQEFLLTTFTVGDYIIPSVTISYVSEKGEKKEIKSEQIFIKVASVGKSESDKEDIRPNKEPLTDKTPNLVYYLSGAFLALLIVGVLLFCYLKKWQPGEESASKTTELPPYEWAQERLSWIKEQKFLENNLVKEHYDTLSDCVRNYLEKLFKLPLMDRTTLEIYGILREEHKLRPHLNIINDFLKESDLIKFAKYVPETSVNETLWQTAENIIESLKPQPINPVSRGENK